jgi:hypothetical protein
MGLVYLGIAPGASSIGVLEPALFSESGVFLLRPDQSIYYIAVQSMRLTRPNFREMISALDFIIDEGYPAGSEYAGIL